MSLDTPRFVECIGPGLAAVAFGGLPLPAYDHRLGAVGHEIRMHRVVNVIEGPRRVEPVVLRLAPKITCVGVSRDRRGRPRIYGVVARRDESSEELCYETVEAEWIQEVYDGAHPQFRELLAEARQLEIKILECFGSHDCSSYAVE